MTPIDYDVAVIGAGPTGLTLTNLLGRMGVRVVLVERNEDTVREPRAVSIDDESLRTMQAVGIAEVVIKDVALDYGSHYYSPSGQCFLKVEPKTREYGFPRRNAFAQPKLEAALRAALKRFPNVEALFGWDCSDVVEHENGVLLTLMKEGERSRTIGVRYLAACDGARSAIRKSIGATLSGSTYRQRWLIVDLKTTKERLRQTRVMCDPNRPFITLPGPDGARRYEFMLREGDDDKVAVRPEFVRKLLAAGGPDADAAIVRQQVYTFHARIADRWNTHRIFLAGDAAHLSPPFAGQGMNSGIRDAHNLGWKLAEVIDGRFGPGLLMTYQIERAPHARALIELAVNMGRVMMPTSNLQAFAIRTGFRAIGLVPRLQEYFSQMKYKPKPFFREGLVVPNDGGLKMAGRLLPQPHVELPHRNRKMLDELLATRFCLVAYGADAQRVAMEALRLDFGLADLPALAILPNIYNPASDCGFDSRIGIARDYTGEFGLSMPSGSNVLLLIRPDRYVIGATVFEPSRAHELAGAVKAMVTRTHTNHPEFTPTASENVTSESAAQ